MNASQKSTATLLSTLAANSGWLLAVTFTVLLVIEYAAYALTRRQWSEGHAVPNMISSTLGFVFNFGFGALVGVTYQGLYENFRLITIPLSSSGLLCAYLLFEAAHYIDNRMGHRVGLLWAIHSVHHSCPEFNGPVAARIFWGAALTQPASMLLSIAGVSPVHYAVLLFATNVWGAVTHTRLIPQLGFLEHIFATPSNHRVHHGRQLKYLDRNYGQTLIVFDKLLGTHKLEDEEPDYGLVSQVDEKNPFKFQLAGFVGLWRQMRSAPGLANKLKYLVMPPGWSHAGAHRTTGAMRAEAAGAGLERASAHREMAPETAI